MTFVNQFNLAIAAFENWYALEHFEMVNTWRFENICMFQLNAPATKNHCGGSARLLCATLFFVTLFFRFFYRFSSLLFQCLICVFVFGHKCSEWVEKWHVVLMANDSQFKWTQTNTHRRTCTNKNMFTFYCINLMEMKCIFLKPIHWIYRFWAHLVHTPYTLPLLPFFFTLILIYVRRLFSYTYCVWLMHLYFGFNLTEIVNDSINFRHFS